MPTDVINLQNIVLQMRQTMSFLQQNNDRLLQQQIDKDKQIEKLFDEIASLQNRLDQLLRLLYGKKTEHLPKQSNGLKTTRTDHSGIKLPAGNVTQHGRNHLPENLARLRVEHTLHENERKCRCCATIMTKIGEEISEQLDFKPAVLFVNQHVRFKYACRHCKGCILTTPLPSQPIDKGLASAGLLSEIIVSKYCDHMPLYRQEQRWQRYGVEIARSTMCDWVQDSAELLAVIVNVMIEELISIRIMHTDDTTVPIQAKGKTHTGRLWVYASGRGQGPPCIVYQYTATRSQEAPRKFLKDYRGYLHADAYAGYDKLYEDGKIVEVACWAHARRKYYEITQSLKSESLADDALEFIGKLYDIERYIKHWPAVARRYYRRRYSKPILKRFKHWIYHNTKTLTNKSPVKKAMNYTLNHWRALCHYCRDGDLNIDNNQAERSIKPLVIGRKNWLFAGSHEGAKNAAIIYSLIETCKQNNINPYIYLKDVLARLPDTSIRDVKQLVPYRWHLLP